MSIAIIGGGITGLSAAYQLTKNNEEIVLYEAEENLGGLTASFKAKNWQWPLENFFHHYFIDDNEVKELAADLNLVDNLFYEKVQTSLFSQGAIYPYDQLSDFLKFPHLNYFDKFRMGSVIFGLRHLPYLPIYNKTSAYKLFPKLIGDTSWNTIWKPLMDGKFGHLSDQIAFSWLWARIKKRSPKLGYFKNGTKVLIDNLEKEIKKKGKIFTNTQITKIKKEHNSWVLSSKDKQFSADKVILALPLPSALKLIQTWKELNDLQVAEWRELNNIGALTLVLRLKKSFLPGETYWLNILEKDFPFLVIVEQTNFIDKQKYGGENIVYIGGYYEKENEIFNQDKEKILNKFSPFLRRLNPSFENFLIDYKLFKYKNAQPVIPVNYAKIKPDITLIPGQLYWATANHIFPWDRGLNYSIKLGKKTANLF
jgi:protoporphyrinogen oxidase